MGLSMTVRGDSDSYPLGYDGVIHEAYEGILTVGLSM